MKMTRKKKVLLYIFWSVMALLVTAGITVMTINNYVTKYSQNQLIYSMTKDNDLPQKVVKEAQDIKPQCILVLGAGIQDRETPTPILQQRLDTGIALYKAKVAPKILLSGDNGTKEHNEIHAMLSYVKKHGVPDQDIFCDHAGFNTSQSMVRAKEIFKVKSLVIVTQSYHEYRALFLADKLGMKAIGIGSDQETLAGQPRREIREIMARNKDFFQMLHKHVNFIPGDAIPISGDGRVSHGE